MTLTYECVICGKEIDNPKCETKTCHDEECKKELQYFNILNRNNYKVKDVSKVGRRTWEKE